MIYICIPARDESRTVGVLLWRIRETMAELGRDYHVLVLDDGSSDDTAALLKRYERVLPLTVLAHDRPRGYGRGVERLLKEAANRVRYPKRDAVVVMQADFTDPPEHLAKLVRTLEGGADVVASVPSGAAPAPWPVRAALRLARFVLGRRGAPSDAGRLCGFRLYRAKVVTAAFEAAAGHRLLARDGWAANAELLAKLAPFARRVAVAPMEPRYDMRSRRSRVRPIAVAGELLRLRRTVAALALWSSVGLAGVPGAAPGQAFVRDTLRMSTPAPARIPFAVGETLRYKVKFGWFNVGEGWMSVPRVDTVGEFPAYAAEWRISGGVPFYKMDSKFYSWMDERTLVSRRFVKDQHEGGRKSFKEYLFFPEERKARRIDYDTTSVMPTALPLDDVSFVYFARTLPLEVGETYVFNRYFKEEGNPVVIRVLRKDERKVGAGKFNTIVVQPVISTDGLFSEGGRAEIHFSDDERRMVVYMETHFAGISLSLHLEEILPPGSAEVESAGSDGPAFASGSAATAGRGFAAAGLGCGPADSGRGVEGARR